MKKLITLLILTFSFQSCDNKPQKLNKTNASIESKFNKKKVKSLSDNTIDNSLKEKLPDWLFDYKIIFKGKINHKYQIDLRLKRIYLKEDFNGDNFEDIVFPIKEISSRKMGFAIIHGQTSEIIIIGAGKMIKNALGDDMNYIDFWEISKEKEVTGTDVDENGALIETPVIFLKFPSIRIEKSELGGGIIFWNGSQYEYLHQTC